MIVVVLKHLLIFYGRTVLYKRKYSSIKAKIYGIFLNFTKVYRLKDHIQKMFMDAGITCFFPHKSYLI